MYVFFVCLLVGLLNFVCFGRGGEVGEGRGEREREMEGEGERKEVIMERRKEGREEAR